MPSPPKPSTVDIRPLGPSMVDSYIYHFDNEGFAAGPPGFAQTRAMVNEVKRLRSFLGPVTSRELDFAMDAYDEASNEEFACDPDGIRAALECFRSERRPINGLLITSQDEAA
jgi:hypothetical protein